MMKKTKLRLTTADLQQWNEQEHRCQVPSGELRAYVCASATDVRGTLYLRLPQ